MWHTKEVVEEPVVWDSEKWRMWADANWVAGCGVLLVRAVRKGGNVRRMVWFGVAAVLSCGVTTMVEIVWVIRKLRRFSVAGELLVDAWYKTLTAMTLFLLQTAEKKEYKDLNGELQGQPNISLEIERLSSDEEDREGFTHGEREGVRK
jgi:hypothetical protein